MARQPNTPTGKLVLIFLALLPLALMAQNPKVFQGKLSYDLKGVVHPAASPDSSAAPGLASSSAAPDTTHLNLTLWMSDNKVRLQTFAPLVQRKGPADDEIRDYGNGTNWKIVEHRKTVVENKFAPAKTAGMPELKDLGETRTIAGHRCQKYKLLLADTLTQIVWLNTSYLLPDAVHRDESGPFFGMKYVPMAFDVPTVTLDNGSRVQTLFVCTGLQETKPPAATFAFPKGYAKTAVIDSDR